MLKVKEPQPSEVGLLRPGQTLFTYLHLAADARARARADGVGRHVHRLRDGRGRATARLPLLAPMSEVAGKIATQAGAFMLEKPLGGRGILLGGVPGVAAANVLVIGGGVVGHERRVHRDRDAGRRVRVRPLDRPSARARSRLRRAAPRPCYSSTLAIEEMLPARRSRDRRRARPRRPCAARDHARAARG